VREPAKLSLYSTESCHLCEQALKLLTPWSLAGWSVQEVDISVSDDLFKRYGLTIPVLRREDTGAELNWPFDTEELADFLQLAFPGEAPGGH
jgi:hypothetical protein